MVAPCTVGTRTRTPEYYSWIVVLLQWDSTAIQLAQYTFRAELYCRRVLYDGQFLLHAGEGGADCLEPPRIPLGVRLRWVSGLRGLWAFALEGIMGPVCLMTHGDDGDMINMVTW